MPIMWKVPWISWKYLLIFNNYLYKIFIFCLGIQIGKKNEWKLAIYIHQIVRLTLTMWSTEAKADGYLQGFIQILLLKFKIL